MPEPSTSLDPEPVGDGSSQYGAYYYQHYWGGGGPYERNERWLAFFGDVADGIIRSLHPASVLDAGCAMGLLVEALRHRGVEAWGIDVSDYAISQVHESTSEYCSVASLSDPLSRKYDLITCIEVVEHIPGAETGKVLANLCGATDRLLLSTTPRDYGEPTHLNVQPPEAWSSMLAQEGFLRDLDYDASYLSPWAALYTRRDEPLPETVRRYDRSWCRLRSEVSEMRSSLLELQEQLGRLQSGEPESRSGMLEEMQLQREEILRLRDLLIGKDAELGHLKGRATQLQEGRSSYAQRLSSRLEGKLLAIARRLVGSLRNPNR